MSAKKRDPVKQFQKERRESMQRQGHSATLKKLSIDFMRESLRTKYSYNFDWLGRPIIQHPQDIIAIQELIWTLKPDLIIETGIAHGGSLILSASILELIGGTGRVVGIDIDIRKHNRRALEAHPLFKRITLIEGSSVAPHVLAKVRRIAKNKKKVLIFLDSSHAHDHVLAELRAYWPLVTNGSYMVVWDTIVEFLPKGFVKNRPWDKGSNPGTAARAFLRENKHFAVDKDMDNKLLMSAGLGGFLKRVR